MVETNKDQAAIIQRVQATGWIQIGDLRVRVAEILSYRSEKGREWLLLFAMKSDWVHAEEFKNQDLRDEAIALLDAVMMGTKDPYRSEG